MPSLCEFIRYEQNFVITLRCIFVSKHKTVWAQNECSTNRLEPRFLTWILLLRNGLQFFEQKLLWRPPFPIVNSLQTHYEVEAVCETAQIAKICFLNNNYKLMVTWLTPTIIGICSRISPTRIILCTFTSLHIQISPALQTNNVIILIMINYYHYYWLLLLWTAVHMTSTIIEALLMKTRAAFTKIWPAWSCKHGITVYDSIYFNWALRLLVQG